jgi:hypothetical protein
MALSTMIRYQAQVSNVVQRTFHLRAMPWDVARTVNLTVKIGS